MFGNKDDGQFEENMIRSGWGDRLKTRKMFGSYGDTEDDLPAYDDDIENKSMRAPVIKSCSILIILCLISMLSKTSIIQLIIDLFSN